MTPVPLVTSSNRFGRSRFFSDSLHEPGVGCRNAGGQAAGARVIDFKTDRVSAPRAPEHAQSYRPQLEAYRDVVARIYDLEPKRVEMVILLVEPGVVVTL